MRHSESIKNCADACAHHYLNFYLNFYLKLLNIDFQVITTHQFSMKNWLLLREYLILFLLSQQVLDGRHTAQHSLR